MKLQHLKTTIFVLAALVFFSCDSKPKVIVSESDEPSETTAANTIPSLQDDSPLITDVSNSEEHKVVAGEVLNTDKYTYVNVEENGEKYWVAISKRDVEEGETYYFKGGLLKKNFYSREFDRTFETVYLVSQFWQQPTGGGSALAEAMAQSQGGETPNLEVGNIEPTEGAIALKELFDNKEKYNGKTVKVTGKCVKANPMIMNRNWIHVQDGSVDGVDLTITTAENIPLGAVVTMEGTIALDKDFGAGYRYDVIMEGAVLR